MKYLVFIFFCLPFFASSQCDGLYFFQSQGTIDSFAIVSDNCTHADSIIVENCLIRGISNLDSLHNLESINYLRLKHPCGSVSIDGLRNIKKINHLEFGFSADVGSTYRFENLDTVLHLDVRGESSANDLYLFKDVEYIERIEIRGEGIVDGLHPNTKQTIRDIRLYGGSGDDWAGGLADLTSRAQLNHFELLNQNNFDLTPHEELYRIDTFRINGGNQDLEGLSDLNIFNLVIAGFEGDIPVFEKIDSLGFLGFFRTENLKTVSEHLPNLKNVDEWIYINLNDNLEQIGLDDIDIPYLDAIPSRPHKVSIFSNPMLDFCNEPFICRALEAYPDSVRVEDNSLGCSLDTLMVYCDKLDAVSEVETEIVVLYPNPVRDILYINNISTSREAVYRIYDIRGALLKKESVEDGNSIDVGALSSGYYILEVSDAASINRQRFVKTE